MDKLIALNMIIIITFVVLGLVHILVLLNLVHKSRKELSSGQLNDFIGAIFVSITIGFLFFLWSMFTKLGILNIQNQVIDIVITSVIAISFLMSITHLGYSAKDISISFGFMKIGEKISKIAQKKK